jgi:hypothetical protein
MTRLLSLTLSILACTWPAIVAAQPTDECDHEAERNAVVNARGAARLEIIARAGRLTVEGKEGLSEVRIIGRACASAEELLDGIQLFADRRANNVRIDALMPETGGWGHEYALLHLIIEAPAGLAAEIEDTSGAMELRGLGALTIEDGSGEIIAQDLTGMVRIRDGSGSIDLDRVTGDVDIDDGSGSIHVAGVTGDVEIHDGSGELQLRDIDGSVELTDGSGSIVIREVTGDVTVRADGSGSIRVADVEGDFIVENDGSGDVSYTNVGGTIRTAAR